VLCEPLYTESKTIYKPLSGDDPKQRQPNIKLAHNELKREPKIQLEEGVKKTLIILRGY